MKRPPTPRRRGDEGCGARIHFGHVAAQVIRMPALNSDELDSIVRPKLERCEHPPRPVNTAKFAWTYFRTSGWQSAVASLIMAGILAGAVSRVPHPWGIWTGVTFTLTGLGALAFALAPWLYAIALAQAVHTGVLVRAEVVVAPGGGEELLVPSHQGAFRRPSIRSGHGNGSRWARTSSYLSMTRATAFSSTLDRSTCHPARPGFLRAARADPARCSERGNYLCVGRPGPTGS